MSALIAKYTYDPVNRVFYAHCVSVPWYIVHTKQYINPQDNLSPRRFLFGKLNGDLTIDLLPLKIALRPLVFTNNETFSQFSAQLRVLILKQSLLCAIVCHVSVTVGYTKISFTHSQHIKPHSTYFLVRTGLDVNRLQPGQHIQPKLKYWWAGRNIPKSLVTTKCGNT